MFKEHDTPHVEGSDKSAHSSQRRELRNSKPAWQGTYTFLTMDIRGGLSRLPPTAALGHLLYMFANL